MGSCQTVARETTFRTSPSGTKLEESEEDVADIPEKNIPRIEKRKCKCPES